jgi:hypothetical protein
MNEFRLLFAMAIPFASAIGSVGTIVLTAFFWQ